MSGLTSKRGLAGVVVDTTAISKVVPQTTCWTYRDIRVQDLAARCSFEQVTSCCGVGELPTDAELALFSQKARTSQPSGGPLDAVIAGPLSPTTATR